MSLLVTCLVDGGSELHFVNYEMSMSIATLNSFSIDNMGTGEIFTFKINLASREVSLSEGGYYCHIIN